MKTSAPKRTSAPKKTAPPKKVSAPKTTGSAAKPKTASAAKSHSTRDTFKGSRELSEKGGAKSGNMPNLNAWGLSGKNGGSPGSLELNGQNLKMGSKNDPGQVKQLQQMLKDGGADIAVDGKFGPDTQSAVRKYQEKNGLQVDGIVGAKTLGALNGGAAQAGQAQDTTKVGQAQGASKVGGSKGTQPAGSAARGKEVKGGRASMKSGTLQLKDPKTGKVLGTYKFNSGGGGRGAAPWGDYEVSNGRRRSDKPTMKVGGFGYSFDLTQKGMPSGQAKDPRFNSPRTHLRIHPDGRGKGTIGCIGIDGDKKTQQDFYNKAKKLAAANGGKFNLSFRPEGYKGEGPLKGEQSGNQSRQVKPAAAKEKTAPSSGMSLGQGETLRRGSNASPDKVKQLQQMLKDKGAGIEVDGKFGRQTEKALRKFQQENNLAADGVFGPKTLAAMQGGAAPQNDGVKETGGIKDTGSKPESGNGKLPIPKEAVELIRKSEGLDQPGKWPKGASGITLGRGYDLGYKTKAQFRKDWAGKLSPSQMRRLESAIGKRGLSAKRLASQFRDIRVSKKAADQVFENVTIPRWYEKAKKAFPGMDKLPAKAQGALTSLVFNRGGGMKGSRRSEMRNIRNILSKFKPGVNTRQTLKSIASQITRMKRLWRGKGLDGLLTRRDQEASFVRTA